eukprot:5120348-Amphidinium_carterae.1
MEGGNKTWGRWRGIQFLLALMLLVPCTRTVDPVRWAAVCTLITTGLALLSPLQARVWPSHVMVLADPRTPPRPPKNIYIRRKKSTEDIVHKGIFHETEFPKFVSC